MEKETDNGGIKMNCKHCGAKMRVWKDGLIEKQFCLKCGYTPGYER